MSQWKKTLILWAVLIAAFVAMYKIFSVPPPDGAPERPSSNGSWIPLIAFAVIFIFFVVWVRLLNGPWVKLQNEGLAAFNSGRYAQALELWQQSAAKAKKQPLPRFNIGIVRLCLWQLEAARTDLEASVAMKPGMKVGGDIAKLAPPPLALIAALLNRPADARAHLSGLTDKNHGNASLAEAVLLIRERKFIEAHPFLRKSEVLNLGGTIGALARVLDAWCAREVLGEKRYVDRVALFSEAHPDGLKTAWPELMAFIDQSPA